MNLLTPGESPIERSGLIVSAVISLISLGMAPSLAQETVGIFMHSEDIGNPKHAGSATFDEKTQEYTVTGSGANVWNNSDEFHYLYNEISGDFILTADFEFAGDLSRAVPHTKVGWMVRQSTYEGSASMNAAKHYDDHSLLQWRPYRGMFMRDPQEERFYPISTNLQTIQLKRTGNIFTMKLAHPGEPLQLVASEYMELKPEVLAGVFICSHVADALAQARIWNVRIVQPVITEFDFNPKIKNVPNRDVMASRIEILDVANGHRKTIYESDGRIQSPNWMPDGEGLLLNAEGSLFTIPVAGGTPVELNTGDIKRSNNNHLISFDGKMVGFTSHRDGGDGDGSTVYTMPISGGEPRMVSENAPSYLHGWNPNGKELLIAGKRNGRDTLNLYKVYLKDGGETALTSNPSGIVEGPEYSPDGKFIYYNSNASGKMQIWRMTADGSSKEQLTFDQYYDWWPHVSPDGNLLAFISYPTDIDPNGHPYNTEVMLRVLKLNAPGGPRVVAHLYGGQGSMNVNTWSPDSKRIAFISNSRPVD